MANAPTAPHWYCAWLPASLASQVDFGGGAVIRVDSFEGGLKASMFDGKLRFKLPVTTTLNQDVTTAFPVDQALGDLQPGVYVMTAAPKGPGSDDDNSLATQWFIVSDLGLTAFSGNDGIHVFVNSLETTQPKSTVQVRLLSRALWVLAQGGDGLSALLATPGSAVTTEEGWILGAGQTGLLWAALE